MIRELQSRIWQGFCRQRREVKIASEVRFIRWGKPCLPDSSSTIMQLN
jgi:hypothetical protein